MRVILEKYDRGEALLNLNNAERARAAVDHNDDVVKKRVHLSERRFDEWMQD